jgi:hypothetical protein
VPPSTNVWICAAGVIVLVIGFVAARRELQAAVGLDKLVAVARVLFAAPLAAFGAEHLVLGDPWGCSGVDAGAGVLGVLRWHCVDCCGS